MALDIYFKEDIQNAIAALDAANKRALALAELYGANPEAMRLVHLAYSGALSDVAASFGLALGEPARDTLAIPTTIEVEGGGDRR